MINICSVCKAEFEGRKGAKTCSDACRMVKHRAEHREPKPIKFCKHCKGYIPITQPHQPHAYCSDACRQAAYRLRRKNELGFMADLVDSYRLQSAEAMQQMIWDLSGHYHRKHGFNWKLIGATVQKGNYSFTIFCHDNTTYIFKNAAIARRWFADYVNTGKPNAAMLRH